jgi:hypothetical protein
MAPVASAQPRSKVSQRDFYGIKEAFEKHRQDGLALRRWPRPRVPDQAPEIEQQTLALTQ